jgi:cold-inducible RNA-binding protein
MHDPSYDRNDQVASASLQEAKVFVGNLPILLDEGELVEAFSPFGKVVDAIILRDRETTRSKGFGFVTFSTKVEARKAAAVSSIELKGRRVDIKLSLPKEKITRKPPGEPSQQQSMSSSPPAYDAHLNDMYRIYGQAYSQQHLAAASAFYHSMYYGMPQQQHFQQAAPYIPQAPIEPHMVPGPSAMAAHIPKHGDPIIEKDEEPSRPSNEKSDEYEEVDDLVLTQRQRRQRAANKRCRSLSPSSVRL